MERMENFDGFYSKHIQPYVEKISRNETAYNNWQRFTIAMGIGCFASFFLNYLGYFPSGNIIAGTMLLLLIVGIIYCARYSDRYIDDFKEKIIGQIITCIQPGSVYKPMGFISKKEYIASGLFRQKFTHFDGDDFWQSEYNGLPFHCSEINAWSQFLSGRDHIFKGLFFTVKLSRSITGGTYIWSRQNVQLPASVADEAYRMFHLPQVHAVKISNTDFNKQYRIYATNTHEALSIVDTAMMDHMLQIKERLKKEIVYSFVAGNCYIAVPFEENLLEPSGKGVKDKAAIRNYFYTILLVFSIIKKLELNSLG